MSQFGGQQRFPQQANSTQAPNAPFQGNPNQFTPPQFFQQQQDRGNFQLMQQIPQQYPLYMIPPPQNMSQQQSQQSNQQRLPFYNQQFPQQPQQQSRQQQRQPYQQQYHKRHDHDNYDADFYFPGAASLSDQLDKRVMIVLRDGKKLIGMLRSYDQFANMVLESTVERIVVGDQFGDLPLGLYMVRGENVVLMGEVDEDKERTQNLRNTSLQDILELQKQEREEIEAKLKKQNQDLRRKGLALDEDIL
jgi:U6 snRNA-associated Sm-like protein LSm1